MDDLISRQALYERATTLESQALDYVGKLIERDGEEYSTEWKIWSAILTERTAFKHDVYDAPSAEKHGRWELKKYKLSKGDEIAYYQCSCCDHATWSIDGWMYCPYCGAKMERKEE